MNKKTIISILLALVAMASTSMDTPSSSSLFYDLAGRPLSNIDTAHKGIYIKDGRKFFK